MRITPTTDANNTMNRPSYNPPGVCKNPIPVRLMETEIAEVDELVGMAGVSRSKVLRDAINFGLPSVRQSILSTSAATPSPTPTVAELSGGEASASPAAFSSLAA